MSDGTYADFMRNFYEENGNSGINFIMYEEEIADAKESTKELCDKNYIDFKRIELDMEMQAEQIKMYNVNSCYRGAIPGELDEIMYNFEILEEFDRTDVIMDLVQMKNLDKFEREILKGSVEENNDLVY